MRDEFASNAFLAVTVAGLFLLGSSLLALAFSWTGRFLGRRAPIWIQENFG